jgi:hypothetical protein
MAVVPDDRTPRLARLAEVNPELVNGLPFRFVRQP